MEMLWTNNNVAIWPKNTNITMWQTKYNIKYGEHSLLGLIMVGHVVYVWICFTV